MGRERQGAATIATALKGSGYRTIMIGKYMNAYQPGNPPYVAPGWDDWHAIFSNRQPGPLLRLLLQRQRHDHDLWQPARRTTRRT